MTGNSDHFGFTKLIVIDLDKVADFYKAVFGLSELARVESNVAGRAISEIMFHPTAEGGASFVLLKFLDQKAASASEVILGFQAVNVDAAVERALAAGGKLVDPVRNMPEHGVRVAFIEDVEGHLIEVVELLGTGH